jgi:amino acid transporter
VLTTAAFAFGGTELTGLAAAESANPAKALPRACKQVFWRITLFYILGTFIVGLLVPYNAPYLLGSSGANTKASPFVASIQSAGIRGLPSVMNAVITLSVISVANSAVFGSTRTIQALAANGMAPRFFQYIDNNGRPVFCIILQILFGFLAFANEASATGSAIFNWLLGLAGISNFFVWASICLAHIRFRAAWKYNGRSTDELAYVAPFGVLGSAFGLFLIVLCLIAEFYVSVATLDATIFFENYLAAPVVIALFIIWKVYSNFSRDTQVKSGWSIFKPIAEIDINSGIRDSALDRDLTPRKKFDTWGEYFKAAPMRLARSVV